MGKTTFNVCLTAFALFWGTMLVGGLASVPSAPGAELAKAALVMMIILCGYFIPAIVAFKGGHGNAAAILILNLFLGWTLIGWVGALVWANTSVKNA